MCIDGTPGTSTPFLSLFPPLCTDDDMKPMNIALRVSREVMIAFGLNTGFGGVGEFSRIEGLSGSVEEAHCRTA